MSSKERRAEIIKLMKEMIPIKSISPASGGTGETKRADYLEALLKKWGAKTKRYTYIDKWGCKRPSIITKYGDSSRTIWVIAHTDTVGVGDLKEWKTNPFEAVVKDDMIYGRGTEDDGHGLASSMIAFKELMESNAKLSKYSYGLALVADEEMGSEYGIQKILKEGIFGKNDMFVVPDGGDPKGMEIEIAEKGMLWIKFIVHGKQVHGSMPSKGINAARLSSELAIGLDKMLHTKYSKSNILFNEKRSTFEITKREPNVESINIIPGRDVFYMDMRILPAYKPSEVLSSIKKFIKKSGIRTTVEVVQMRIPTSTNPSKSRLVSMLSRAIKRELRVKPKLIGIGGGTVASFVREAGFDAVVWGIEDFMAHQPNEYVTVSGIEREISVIKRLFLGS